jgi:hypothetical protein
MIDKKLDILEIHSLSEEQFKKAKENEEKLAPKEEVDSNV